MTGTNIPAARQALIQVFKIVKGYVNIDRKIFSGVTR